MDIYEQFIEDSKFIQDSIDDKDDFVDYLKENEKIDILRRFYENNDFDYNDNDSEYIIDIFNKYDHVDFEEFLIYAKTIHSSLKTETQINQSTGKEELSIYQRLYGDYLDFCENKTNLKTLFNYACFRSFEKLFNFLHSKIEIDNQALISACRGGQLEIIKKLNFRDFKDGFFEACKYGKIKIVEYFFPEVKPDEIADGFIVSCRHNRKEIFDFFMDKNLEIKDKKLGFIISAGYGNLELAKILYPFANFSDKDFAFELACREEKLNSVNFLIDDNITIFSKWKVFLKTNNSKIFCILYSFLLDNMYILEERFIADCECNNLKFVKLLFEDFKYKLGHAIEVSIVNLSFEVLDFFIEKGVGKNTVFEKACLYNSLDIVQKYVDDVDDKVIKHGFICAANNMNITIVDFLFDRIDKKILKEIMKKIEHQGNKYIGDKIRSSVVLLLKNE